ncbi:MAG: hypothetical protein U5J96_03125 [Ignavibacteriaceae bacterium]|nr:hypothetical protein [Ignavibacteriaceae bacterium]
MKKWILSSLVFILTLAVTVFIGFYAAIFLIGPHTGILPEAFFIPVGIFLLIIIIGIPVLLTRFTFHHFKEKEKNNLSK